MNRDGGNIIAWVDFTGCITYPAIDHPPAASFDRAIAIILWPVFIVRNISLINQASGNGFSVSHDWGVAVMAVGWLTL
jgi:hypothetical protein